MLDVLKNDLVTALGEAVRSRYGALELPPLTFGFPPDVAMGDLTFGAFPLAKPLRKAPAQIAAELAGAIAHPAIRKAEAVGPYLNLTIEPAALFQSLAASIRSSEQRYGFSDAFRGHRAIVEFSSPNTNKPLHLGHIRNIALGDSSAALLEAVGYDVVRVCLVNDRGIQICQSMLAYEKHYQGQTPASRGQKGDHFVGECYVTFARALKNEKTELEARFAGEGLQGDELKKRVEETSPMLRESRELLRRWEAGDPDVRALWRQMNSWVLEGHNETYDRLGVHFDRFYFESELYTRGRDLVLEALSRGVVQQRDDGSIIIDLSDLGLDPKVLLRRDGTSLYITQDIGVAFQKWEDYQPERSIYVIAVEQDHQMRVLFEILRKMGCSWAGGMHHLSYGMVNLPEGRMKSREGRVVDADDLLDEMFQAAQAKAQESRPPEKEGDEALQIDAEAQAGKVALGAVKFFMLKTNPRKDFVFNPEESIDFQGDTGPYVQYTHARIRSILRKAAARGFAAAKTTELTDFGVLGNPEERALARSLADFPRLVAEAAEKLQPSLIATYLLEVASAFNRFYHHHSVLRAEDETLVRARLALSELTSTVIASGLELMGINAPEAM